MKTDKTKELKEKILEGLQSSYGLLEPVIQSLKISREDIEQLIDSDFDFKSKINSITEKSVDLAEKSLLTAIKDGNVQATTFFLKAKGAKRGYSDEVNDLKNIKSDVMALLIETMETKGECLKRFASMFKVSASASEDFYKKVMIERQLISPNDRKKQELKNKSDLLSERFKNGLLGEVEMYKKLMEIHLRDAELAEFPSERSRATDQAIQIQRRLEEIEEREKRKKAEKAIDVAVKVDALLLGCSYDQILQNQNILLEIKEFERELIEEVKEDE
jgi:hypothetical protein